MYDLSLSLSLSLPKDILINILSFDDRFIVKKGKILPNNKLSKNDNRYNLLLTIPIKKYNRREDKWEVDLNICFSSHDKGYKYMKLLSTEYNEQYKIILETLINVGSSYAFKLINYHSFNI